jgi:hypothetical protein
MRLISIALFTSLCAILPVGGAQIREFDLKTTESLGRQLYEQSANASKRISPRFLQARQISLAALPQIDRSRYHFEVLKDPTGDGLLVYALADSKNPNDVVLGVHYRVSVTGDAKSVKAIDALSRSALVVNQNKGIPKGATAGPLWTINLMSLTPLETHVYLSLLHHTPIYIGTADHSIWKVDGERISKIRGGH